jgi:hypothetical protein
MEAIMIRGYLGVFIFIFLVVAGIATPAHAVTLDLDFSGTVGSGSVDALGLFGTAGNSLTGDQFSANVYYSVPRATILMPNSTEETVQPVTYALTINNQTVTPASLASFGPITSSQLQASTPQGCCGISANVITETAPPDTAGSFDSQLLLSLISTSLYPSGTQPNLLSPFAYTRQPSDTQGRDEFLLGGWNSTSDFTEEQLGFNVDNVSLSPTPLPSALSLFSAALSGLAGFAWRRRAAVKHRR